MNVIFRILLSGLIGIMLCHTANADDGANTPQEDASKIINCVKVKGVISKFQKMTINLNNHKMIVDGHPLEIVSYGDTPKYFLFRTENFYSESGKYVYFLYGFANDSKRNYLIEGEVNPDKPLSMTEMSCLGTPKNKL